MPRIKLLTCQLLQDYSSVFSYSHKRSPPSRSYFSVWADMKLHVFIIFQCNPIKHCDIFTLDFPACDKVSKVWLCLFMVCAFLRVGPLLVHLHPHTCAHTLSKTLPPGENTNEPPAPRQSVHRDEPIHTVSLKIQKEGIAFQCWLFRANGGVNVPRPLKWGHSPVYHRCWAQSCVWICQLWMPAVGLKWDFWRVVLYRPCPISTISFLFLKKINLSPSFACLCGKSCCFRLTFISWHPRPRWCLTFTLSWQGPTQRLLNGLSLGWDYWKWQ